MDRILKTHEAIELCNKISWTRVVRQLHVHHVYAPSKADFAKKPDGLYWNQSMREYHMKTRGWRDIAQHLTLLPTGDWVTGRDFNWDPASIAGWETGAFSIEMIGNFDKEKFEPPQSTAMFEFCTAFCIQKRLNVDTDVKFHRDSPSAGKTCPGKLIDRDWFMNTLKARINGMEPIMGKAQATAEQMDAYLRKVNPDAPAGIAEIFLEEGEKEGVRGDLTFAQSLKETNYFRFGGQAKAEWHNPAGLGVTGQKVNGEYIGNKFPDWRTGIRAQTQHAKGYATKDPLNQPCVDTRYSLVTKGIAPNWEQLNGKWAVPGLTYGQDIIKIWQAILATKVESTDWKTKYDETIQRLDLAVDSMNKASAKLNALKAEISSVLAKY